MVVLGLASLVADSDADVRDVRSKFEAAQYHHEGLREALPVGGAHARDGDVGRERRGADDGRGEERGESTSSSHLLPFCPFALWPVVCPRRGLPLAWSLAKILPGTTIVPVVPGAR